MTKTSRTDRRTAPLRLNPIAFAVAMALAGTSAVAIAANPAPGAKVGTEVRAFTGGGSIAADAAGDFMVLGVGTFDAGGAGVRGQLHKADGGANGGAFIVNTYTPGSQRNGDVAMDAAGDSVVVWSSTGQDGPSYSSIHAQRYAANGTKAGAEFEISSNPTKNLDHPRVEMDAAGDFVVTWLDYDGSGWGISARLYNADGSAKSASFGVNTTKTGSQIEPDVAMDAAGDFVVTWTDNTLDGSSYGVFAQRFSASGTPLGSQFQVNTTTAGNQGDSFVAMDAAGDFAITWSSNGQDGDLNGIYAQRYSADGTLQGTEFQVNTYTTGNQWLPGIAMDAAGDFLIAWQDSGGEDGGGYGVFAQRYDAEGDAVGGETQVNTTTTGNQGSPRVAADAAGDFIVTWSQDSLYGGYFQLFSRITPSDLSASLDVTPSGDVPIGGSLSLSASVTNNAAAVDTTGNTTIDAGLTAAFGITASITLPAGAAVTSTSGTGWTCPASPTGSVLTCSYSPSLLASGTTPVLTIAASAPSTEGVAAFSNDVAGDQPDASLDNNDASLGVNVSGHAPVASAGTLTLDENTSGGGDLGATDADSDTLTYSKVSGPTHGVATVDSDGSYSYTPTTNYHGADSFTFKANDGAYDSNTATVSLTVTHVNQAPVASAGTLTLDENASGDGNLSASDVDGDSLTYSVVSTPGHGALTVNSDGSYSYTPTTNYHGADSFTFKVNDGHLDSNTATVSLTVTHVNQAPVASTGTLTLDENTSADGTVAATDVDGDSMTYSKASSPAHGAVTVNSDGSYSYTPAANYHGADSFTFKANDGHLDSNGAAVSITVNHINQAPVANSANASVNEDTVHHGTVSAADVDGDTLIYSKVDDPAHGTVSIATNGSYTYTPTTGYSGTDSFTYKANDGALDSNTATVSLTINHVDTAPIAKAASLAVDHNTARSGSLKSTDADGDSVTYVKVAAPKHGTLSLTKKGGYTYTPAKDYSGTDSFTFTANDGTLTSTAAKVSITVTEHTPTATATSFSMTHNTSHTGTLKGTDADGGDTLTFSVVTAPKHGTLKLLSNGTYSYKPTANYKGADKFTFHVNDGSKSSAAATVAITVK